MNKSLLMLAALAVSTGGCAKAGVTVTGPGNLDAGASGTVTVTVTNDNPTATPARDVTLAVTVFYTDLGVSKKLDASTTFHVAAGSGSDWLQPRFVFPVVEGVEYDWSTVKFGGAAPNPVFDSGHTAQVDRLKPGETWTTSVKVKAP
jgi:hypothetical protein